MTHDNGISAEEFAADKLDVPLEELPREAMVFLGVADGREVDDPGNRPNGGDTDCWEVSDGVLTPIDSAGIEVETVRSPKDTDLTVEGRDDLTLSIAGSEGAVRTETENGHEIMLDDDADTLTVEDADGSNRIELDSASGEVSISAASKITLDAPDIEVSSHNRTAIDSAGTIDIDRTTETNVSSTGQLNLDTDGLLALKSAGVMTLKGALIRLS